MIDVGTEEKLEKLVRLLSSDKEGEVVAAAHAIKRTLANAGSDIHELADRIRGGKLSENRRCAKSTTPATRPGRTRARRRRASAIPPPVRPGSRWRNTAPSTTTAEREFIDDMTRWCMRREPTEKQGKWLHLLYVRIGRRR